MIFSFRTALCISLAFALVLLTACATAPAPVNLYDFGTAPETSGRIAGCDLPPVNLANISSPAALDSNLMLYRLQYDNGQQSHAYAAHRWTMPPAQLLTVRIKSQLADNQAHHVHLLDSGIANPDGWQLRLDLMDFAQYFDDAKHSYAQLQLRATLLRANTLVAQSTFRQRAPADSPDAPGGARAMRHASDAFISDLSTWLCKQPRP